MAMDMAVDKACIHQAWLDSARFALVESPDACGHTCQPIIISRKQAATRDAQYVQERRSLEMVSMEEALAALGGAAMPPSIDDCVCILQKCRKMKNLIYALHMHMHIRKSGLETHKDLGNYLVPMFVECGSIHKAEQVFHRLVHRNEHSWTSLIQGYIDCGEPNRAFNLFREMQDDFVQPSKHTFVALLNACARLKHMERGQEMHAEIAKEGFEVYPFIGNALVDMYAKCGSLADASEVLNKLLVRDVVSWTALMAGYAEQGFGEEALKCFEQMQSEGVSPNAVTYVCILKACGSIGAIDRGREIHAEIVREELEKGPFIENTLVDMYAKCGLLLEARELFDTVPLRDVVSWNTLITGYAEHGSGEEALKCFERMGSEGILPDSITFVCSLKACGVIGAIDKGRELHAETIRKEFESDLFVGSTLVGMYAKCGSVAEARDVLDELPGRGVVTWNALITGFAEHGLEKEALSCLEQMQVEGLFPDVVAWSAVILSHVEQGENEEAFGLFSRMQEQGIAPNRVTFVSILKACGNLAAIHFGQNIHAKIYNASGLEATSIVMATALIDMYGDCGSMVDAHQVFDAMPAKDLVSWNALIRGYSRQGETDFVFQLFERVREVGMNPDGITSLSVLTTCSHVGMLDEGEKHFEDMGKKYRCAPTIQHHNCMVNLLCRMGQLDVVVAMLEKMPFQPDVVTWSTMLGACRKWGDAELGRQVFERAVGVADEDAAAFILMSNIFADAYIWDDGMDLDWRGGRETSF